VGCNCAAASMMARSVRRHRPQSKTCAACRGDLFGGRGPTGDRIRHGLAGDPFAQAYVHQRTPEFWVTDHRIARM